MYLTLPGHQSRTKCIHWLYGLIPVRVSHLYFPVSNIPMIFRNAGPMRVRSECMMQDGKNIVRPQCIFNKLLQDRADTEKRKRKGKESLVR